MKRFTGLLVLGVLFLSQNSFSQGVVRKVIKPILKPVKVPSIAKTLEKEIARTRIPETAIVLPETVGKPFTLEVPAVKNPYTGGTNLPNPFVADVLEQEVSTATLPDIPITPRRIEVPAVKNPYTGGTHLPNPFVMEVPKNVVPSLEQTESASGVTAGFSTTLPAVNPSTQALAPTFSAKEVPAPKIYQYQEVLAQLILFIRAENRFPRFDIDPATPEAFEEVRLALSVREMGPVGQIGSLAEKYGISPAFFEGKAVLSGGLTEEEAAEVLFDGEMPQFIQDPSSETLELLETFIAKNNRWPRTGVISEYGRGLSLAEMSPEGLEEVELGRRIRNVLENVGENSTDRHIATILKLKENFATPNDKILTELETFIAKNNRWPRTGGRGLPRSPEELEEVELGRSIRNVLENVGENPTDPAIVEMLQIKEGLDPATPIKLLSSLKSFVAKNNRLPSEYVFGSRKDLPPAKLEELELAWDLWYIGIGQNSTDPAVVEMLQIMEHYKPLTLLADLETFVAKYDRWPTSRRGSGYLHEKSSFGHELDRFIKKAQKYPTDDPVTMRILQIYKQLNPKLPTSLLFQLRAFVKKNSRFPRSRWKDINYATDAEEEEFLLYRRIYDFLRKFPEDPVAVEILQIKQKFSSR